MTQSPRNRPLVYALYANGALLLAILITLLTRGSSGSFLPAASGAIAPQPIAGNGSLYLMPGQLLNNVWGCYILDVDSQTLCVYDYSGSRLELKAARNIRYDHALTNYNTRPDPDEIRKIVIQEIQKMNAPAQAPAPGAAGQPIAPGQPDAPETQPAPAVEKQ